MNVAREAQKKVGCSALAQKIISSKEEILFWTMWGLNPRPLACKASDTTTDLTARCNMFDMFCEIGLGRHIIILYNKE